MAIFVASVNPLRPIMAIYAYEIVKTLALPHGADETAVIAFSPPVFMIGFPGKYGTS